MTSSIVRLLLSDVQKSPGSYWQVMDNEHLNRDIFQIIISDPRAIGIVSNRLVGQTFGPSLVKREPDRGVCDLLVTDSITGRTAFIEFKVWHRYHIDQIEKLRQRLDSQSYGLAILLGQTGCQNTAEQIRNASMGRIRKVSYAELIDALENVVKQQSGDPFTLELAGAYAEALRGHRERIRSELSQEPDT